MDPQSGADTTTGTPALERTTPLKEWSSLRVTNQTGSYVAVNVGSQAAITVTAYLMIAAAPSGDTAILAIRNGSTTIANVQLTLPQRDSDSPQWAPPWRGVAHAAPRVSDSPKARRGMALVMTSDPPEHR